MKYYIIAGERSGDLHGSNLVKAIKKIDPDAVFRGFGGDYMKESGVEIITHYGELSIMGFSDVIKNIFKFKKYLSDCVNDINTWQPDAVIFIDFAGFNMRVAKRITSGKIMKFYYIAPKIWAWNQKRAFKLKKTIDDVFVILPFEEPFFRKFGVNAKYVGNPVLDAINSFESDEGFLARHTIVGTNGLIALLPGSRKSELIYSLPVMTKVAKSFPDKTFGLSIIKNLPSDIYEKALKEPNIIPVEEDNYNLLLNADAAIVTSGTATLEAALFEVPQVVVFRTSPFNYTISKSVIKVRFISLVNLIADEEVVKEFIQKDFTPEILTNELNTILNDESYIRKMLKGYRKIRKMLGEQNASENAAKEICEILTNCREEFIR